MPAARSPFQYAILRAVPDAERGECLNVGVVLFARTREFLGLRTELDRDRLRALAPATDAGPIARMPVHARFHWLVAPASMVVRPSAVHTGLCDDPEATLARLHGRLVAQVD